MIVEYIRYKIAYDRQSAFVEAYRQAAAYLQSSPYCLSYELTHCEEDSQNFVLRIEWTSTEEHLNGFRKSPQFAPFLQLVRPYFNEIEEMNHYKLTDVAYSKQIAKGS